VSEELDAERDEIVEEVTRYIEYWHSPKLPEDEHFVLRFKHQPGIGKTVSVLNSCIDHAERFVFLGAMHEVVAENLKVPILHMEGRTRVCQNERMAELERNYCIPLSQGICKQYCDQYPCIYYQKLNEWRRGWSWVGVHHHLGNLFQEYVQSDHFKDLDVLLLDENFYSALKTDHFFYPRAVEWNIEVSESLGADTNLLECFIDLGSQNYGMKKMMDIRKSSKKWDSEIGGLVQTEILRKYLEGERIMPSYISILNAMVTHLESKKFKLEELEKMIVTKQLMTQVSWFNPHWVQIEKPIIVMDATTDNIFLSNIFKKHVQIVEDVIVGEKGNLVFQISDRTYSMSSLDANQGNLLKKVFGYIEKIAKKHDKILVVGRKKYADRIASLDLKNVSYAWYEGLRGTNEYIDYDAVVLMGGCFPNPKVVERDTLLLNMNEEVITRVRREDEMVQAFHRIRPLLNTEKVGYIFSNIDIGVKTIPINRNDLDFLLSGKSKELFDLGLPKKRLAQGLLKGEKLSSKLVEVVIEDEKIIKYLCSE